MPETLSQLGASLAQSFARIEGETEARLRHLRAIIATQEQQLAAQATLLRNGYRASPPTPPPTDPPPAPGCSLCRERCQYCP